MNTFLDYLEKNPKKSLIFIVIFGALLRLAAVLTTPGLWGDEATNGNDALLANQHGFAWFYEANNGREGLYINFMAILFRIFGSGVFTLRLTSALIGLAVLPVFFYLVRGVLVRLDVKRSTTPALISTLLLAVSHWHLAFSRIGFRASLGILMLCLGLHLLLKARGQRIWLLLSGLIIGLGMHTYIAFRLIPIIFIAYLLIETEVSSNFKERVSNFFIWFIGFMIAFAPLLNYFMKNPGSFTGRSSQVSVLASEAPIANLAASTGKTAVMFNLSGDCNARHGINCFPQLDPLTGIFALLGIVAIFALFRKGWNHKTKLAIFLLLLFGATLLPSIITIPSELPHALRVLLALPIIFIFASYGWSKFSNFLSPTVASYSILLTILLNSGFFFYHQLQPETAVAFHGEVYDKTLELVKYAESHKVAIVVSRSDNAETVRPFSLEHYTFLSAEHNQNITYLNFDQLQAIPLKTFERIVFTYIEESLVRDFATSNQLYLVDSYEGLTLYNTSN